MGKNENNYISMLRLWAIALQCEDVSKIKRSQIVFDHTCKVDLRKTGKTLLVIKLDLNNYYISQRFFSPLELIFSKHL